MDIDLLITCCNFIEFGWGSEWVFLKNKKILR